MPIFCPILFPRVACDQMREIDFAVMRHAFEAQHAIGRFGDESLYQHELLRRLKSSGIDAVAQVPIELSFRECKTMFKLDLVVREQVIYELKTVSGLAAAHEAQLLCYLFLCNATRGKLINFRAPTVESRFVNTSLDYVTLRQCTVDISLCRDDHGLSEFVQELVADWGTGLHPSLYRRAILKCLSTEAEPEQMLPMNSRGQCIGNQRFHLLDQDTALGVTALSRTTEDTAISFQKLLAASPLRRMHWLNIRRRRVTLRTIDNLNRKM